MASLKNLQRAGAVLFIMVATFLVYWPAQRNGFVWDDTALVLRDPLIRSWRLIPEGFRHFLFIDATASNFYRPLQRLSFVADYAAWARFPRGYHLTSIYVHLAAAVALWALIRKLLASSTPQLSRWRMLLPTGVAILWAIHPVHTSAVTYIAGRADPLAAFFGFTGLVLGLVSLERGARARLAGLGAALCFLAALLSKESGVAALLIWLLLLLWRREQWRFFGRWAAAAVAILIVYGGLRFSAQKTPPPPPELTPLAVRPILAARAVAEYTGLLLAPVNLRMERDVSTTPRATQDETMQHARRREFQTLLGCGILVALAFWLRWSWRRLPLAAFCTLAAAVAYVPVSNVFSLNATVAEHWLYLPSAFLFLAAALAIERFAGASRLWISAAAAIALAWGCWLGWRTWQRQGDWLDQRTFLTRTIADGGDTVRMWVNLGQLESAEGRDDLAIEHFKTALRREADHPFALLGFAAVSLRLKDYANARKALDRAEGSPFLRPDLLNLRAVLEQLENGADPTPLLGEAAALNPRFWPAQRRYILALEQQGRREESLTKMRELLQEQDFRADSWSTLADLLARARQPQLAAAALEEALRRDVHDETARAYLAILRRVIAAPEAPPEPEENRSTSQDAAAK